MRRLSYNNSSIKLHNHETSVKTHNDDDVKTYTEHSIEDNSCDTMLVSFMACILIGHTLEKERVKRKDDGMVCFDDTRDLPIATVSTLTTILGSWPNRIWSLAVMLSGITRLSMVPLILYKKFSEENSKIKPTFIAICSCLEHLAVMGLVFLYWSPDYENYMKLKKEQLQLDESDTGTILPAFEYFGHYIFFSIYALSFLTCFFVISSFENYGFVKKWAWVLVCCLFLSTTGFLIRESYCVPYLWSAWVLCEYCVVLGTILVWRLILAKILTENYKGNENKLISE